MAIDIKKLEIKKIETIFEEIKTLKKLNDMQNEVVKEYDAYFKQEHQKNLGLLNEAIKEKIEELNNLYKQCIIEELKNDDKPTEPTPAQKSQENNNEE